MKSMPTTVWAALEVGAQERPSQIATWVSGESLTFRHLQRYAIAFGRELIRGGVAPGDRIAVWCPTSREALVTFFAAAYARAIFAPLNPRLTSREASAMLDRLDPRVLVFTTSYGTTNEPLSGTLDWVERRRAAGISAPDLWLEGSAPPGLALDARSLTMFLDPPIAAKEMDARLDTPPVPSDPFLIQMTSGSTAAPKAVLLAQGQCIRMGYELGVRFDMRPGDRYFVCNPIHHVGCTNFGLLTALSHGASFYSLREFTGDAAIAAVQENECTHHHGIEAHYLYELRSPKLRSGVPTVRIAVTPGDIARNVMEAFGPVTTVSVYGSSETTASPFASDYRDPVELRVTTDGRALPGVEAMIADPETGQTVPAGTVGEIRIRGWCVMLGYFRDPAATSAAIDEQGWYHTGDLGKMDDDGNLTFFARVKDFLRVGGENVAAAEIESVLQSHPSVRTAAVVPVPHEVLGQVPVAFVVDKEDVASTSADELVRYCADKLASFKVPRRIHKLTLDDLPMTGPGKVKKSELERRAVQFGNPVASRSQTAK